MIPNPKIAPEDPKGLKIASKDTKNVNKGPKKGRMKNKAIGLYFQNQS